MPSICDSFNVFSCPHKTSVAIAQYVEPPCDSNSGPCPIPQSYD